MSNANRIMCGKCGHVFDHNPKFHVHCRCKGCGASISIPDSRNYYLAHHTAPAASPMATSGPSGAGRVVGRTPSADPSLPPVVRDNAGVPMKPETPVNKGDTPRHDADYFSFVKRRAEQLAKEKAERIASQPLEESA